MNLTIAAVLAILVLFAGMYYLMPEGIPGMENYTGVVDSSGESNGMIGRLYDDLTELAWYPHQVFLAIVLGTAVVSGIVVYWRRIED